MQNTSNLISSIFKSRKTLVQLMEKQGYDISEYEHNSMTETNAKYSNNQLDMLFDSSKDEDVKIRKTYVKNKLKMQRGKFEQLRKKDVQIEVYEVSNLS